MCNKVLFPAPDCPTMASISPLRTWKDRFSKSRRSVSPERNTFFKLSTRSSGSWFVRCKSPLLRLKGRRGTSAARAVASFPDRKTNAPREKQPLHRASDPLDHEEEYLTPADFDSGAKYAKNVYLWERMQCDRSHTLLEREQLRCRRIKKTAGRLVRAKSLEPQASGNLLKDRSELAARTSQL